MQQKNKRVIFVVEDGEGIARPLYRGKIPAEGFTKLGWSARSLPILYEQESHTWNGCEPGETIRGLTPKFIVAHTLLSPKRGTRPNEPLELNWEPQKEIVESVRAAGQYFFFDLDDNVWELPEWNPAYGKPYGITSHLKEWTEDFNSSNGLICSTRSIAESARNNGVKVPIHVVRNCIRPKFVRRGLHTPLRIGYIGLLDFRKPDFEIIIEPLKKALAGFRDRVEFWHLGASFEPGKQSIRELLRPFPVDIVERPWCHPSKFQDGLRELDLGLLPSVRHPFNDGRSNVVGLELMAAGVPFLASQIAEYRFLDTKIDCCVEENDPARDYNWQEEIEETVKATLDPYCDWEERWRNHAEGVLLNNYTPKHMAQQYERVFEECINRF